MITIDMNNVIVSESLKTTIILLTGELNIIDFALKYNPSCAELKQRQDNLKARLELTKESLACYETPTL